MEYKVIIDQHIKGRLEDTFGRAVAMLIMMSATNSANTPIIDPQREDYMRFIEAVCSDQRVLDMWGHSGAQDVLGRWKALAQ